MFTLNDPYNNVDYVFGELSTTDKVYRTIAQPIRHSVMQGFNGITHIATYLHSVFLSLDYFVLLSSYSAL